MTARRARRFVWIASGSLLLGLAVSLGMDVYQDHAEAAAFRTAAPIEGTIVAVTRATVTAEGTVYRLTCRFSADEGRTYTLPIPVFDRVSGGFGANVPPATAQAIRSGAVPSPVALCHDPNWPRRFWLRGIGHDPGAYLEAGYSGLGKLVMIIQGLEVVFLILLLRQKIQDGLIPWWYQVPAFVPFMVEAVLLAIFGPIFRWGRGG